MLLYKVLVVNDIWKWGCSAQQKGSGSYLSAGWQCLGWGITGTGKDNEGRQISRGTWGRLRTDAGRVQWPVGTTAPPLDLINLLERPTRQSRLDEKTDPVVKSLRNRDWARTQVKVRL